MGITILLVPPVLLAIAAAISNGAALPSEASLCVQPPSHVPGLTKDE